MCAHVSKAIMMVVAYGLCTKRSSRHTNVILFLDAIKAWYLLSKQASGPFRPLDADAADGSLRADGWSTLGECLGIIPWDARAAWEAKVLLSCLPQALRIRCIFRNMFVDAGMRVVTASLLNPVADCLVSCD